MGVWYLCWVRTRSGKVWVAVKGKILSARSVRGIPVEHRWGEDRLSWVDRVPWNRYKEALDADGEMPEDDGKRWYSEGRFNFVRSL